MKRIIGKTYKCKCIFCKICFTSVYEDNVCKECDEKLGLVKGNE